MCGSEHVWIIGYEKKGDRGVVICPVTEDSAGGISL
jgi:hypothetical protein